MKFKVLKKHRKGCTAVLSTQRRSWSHPWGTRIGFEFRTESGRAHKYATKIWELYCCNSLRCRAILAVMSDCFLIKAKKLGVYNGQKETR